MEKIDFINNQQPALNATNLNKLQQNVEDDIGDLTQLETSAKNNLVEAINEAASTGGDIEVYNEYTTSATDAYSCNYVNGLETYSTSETRIGTWMDKPLYRKVVEFSNLTTTGQTIAIASNINRAWIDFGDSWCSWGGNRSYIGNFGMTDCYINNDNMLALKSSQDTLFGEITVKYTKTTD